MDVTIRLNKESSYPKTTLRNKNSKKTIITMGRKEKISGSVVISKPNKPFQHNGLHLIFGGYCNELGKSTQFHLQDLFLSPPSKIEQEISYPFELTLNAPFDSYASNNVQISYCLKAEFNKNSLLSQITQTPKEGVLDLFIKTYSSKFKGEKIIDELSQPNLKFQVQIDSNVFSTKGVIKGHISFQEVNLENPIEQVNLVLIRKEHIDNEIIETKLFTLEVLDGSPEDLITVPFKMFLEPLSLSPTTSSNIASFSLSYDLRLNLETEKKRLFKAWEIVLYRKKNKEKKKKSLRKSKSSRRPLSNQPTVDRTDSLDSLNELLRESSSRNAQRTPRLIETDSSHSSISQHTDLGIELNISTQGDSSEDLIQ